MTYTPSTGELVWKFRPREHFLASRQWKWWNTRYSGREVGGERMFTDGGPYRYFKLDKKSYLAHRVIWKLIHGYWPENIDHINGNGVDNRLVNLREVTMAENMKNKKAYKSNTSGVSGVYWCKRDKRWVVKISGRYVGGFASLEGAAAKRAEVLDAEGYHPNHERVV